MGLDITFKRCGAVKCPNCGESVKYEVKSCVYSGGRCWYDILEHIGYYVPHEKRPENFVDQHYGTDMMLDPEDAIFIANNIPVDLYNAEDIDGLICAAIVHGDKVAVNADW